MYAYKCKDVAACGVVGHTFLEPYLQNTVTNLAFSVTAWNGRRDRVKAPCAKGD